MPGTIVFVVDLEATGAPPAGDTVRQLLALIEALPEEGGNLDWRLVSVSLNSPLRAELAAFTPSGDAATDTEVAAAAEDAFGLLDATNDNEPEKRIRLLRNDDRRRLRTLLQPMKDKAGTFSVSIPGRFDRIVRAERADEILTIIAKAPRRRSAELGSVEGTIVAVGTHYNSPAVRIRLSLTGDEVQCVFNKPAADKIGAEHTLDEVWAGRRVTISGRVSYDAEGRPTLVTASDMRSLNPFGEAAGKVMGRVRSGSKAVVLDQDWEELSD